MSAIKRGTKPADPHCVLCHTRRNGHRPMTAYLGGYTPDDGTGIPYPVGTLGVVCGQCPAPAGVTIGTRAEVMAALMAVAS